MTANASSVSGRRTARVVAVSIACLAVLILGLSVPVPQHGIDGAPDPGRSFVWDQDSLWRSLETEYTGALTAGCVEVANGAVRFVSGLDSMIAQLANRVVNPDDAILRSIERDFFALGPTVAACPAYIADYVRIYARMREEVKRQSRRWDVNSDRGRDRLYRSLYGGRAAVEEVMLQHPDSIVALMEGVTEPSATPSVNVRGVEVHSGDMLVSRGGYPTSALIARGNDYPGNFSHVALVHVDEATRDVSVIEAHIEIGVAIATAEEYLQDKKLRLMVLRPRADLPQLVADPMLPHRAASLAMERARSGHIPYDFEMDYQDASRLFCSEVASSVYRELGVELWMGISTISAEGLRRWLASFGVRHFETQEPSDLEYDPQLVVVAEWRDPISLFQDHVDNAVIDAMLEGAARGDDLRYPWYQLPIARLAKGYSWVVGRFGGQGPVPEGMAPSAALRSTSFSDRQRRIAARVHERAEHLTNEQGYPPPYWTLLDLAREEALTTP